MRHGQIRHIDEDLRGVGEDATSTFESDPNFKDSEPTASASSENLVQDEVSTDITRLEGGTLSDISEDNGDTRRAA